MNVQSIRYWHMLFLCLVPNVISIFKVCCPVEVQKGLMRYFLVITLFVLSLVEALGMLGLLTASLLDIECIGL